MNKKDREELGQIVEIAFKRAMLPEGNFNYYQATENVLYTYPKLCEIVKDFEAYIFMPEKSKSITSGASNGFYRDGQDIKDEKIAERMESFERTKRELYFIDTILDRFRGRESFKVIEMYYFGLDAEGNEQDSDDPITFQDIAITLGRSEKTVRAWRTKIIKNIAVLLFGFMAAPSINRLTK